MTNCNYIIQLPGSGSGSIIIPANYGTIENTPEITSKLESLDREADNFLEVVSEIVDEFYELTGKTILEKEQIYDIINDNLDNISEIIPIINNEIENNSEFNNLAKAIKQHLIKNKNFNPYLANELKEQLATPITKEYFNRVSLTGIFNTTSIKSEHLKIQSKLKEASASGFNPTYLYSLNDFLQSIKKYNPNLYSENTLFGTNNQFGIKSINVNQLNFFRNGDLNTLFVSLLKRVGSSIDIDILNSILNSDYKKTTDFFNQKLTKAKDIKNSDFENLLNSTNPEDKKRINSLIEEITKVLKGGTQLRNSIKSLIIDLNKILFSEEYQNQVSLEELYAEAEFQFAKEYRNLKYSNIFEQNTENLGIAYSELKQTAGENAYEEAIKNIVIGQDLVKFRVNRNPVNALVTDIFVREKQGKIVGVNIRGIYKTSEGKFEEVSQDFLNSQPIEYRSKEDIKLEYTEDYLKNELSLYTKYKLSQDTLKYILSGGDVVNGKYIVSGIYPEYIVTKVGEDLINIPYSKITSVSSNTLYKLHNKLEDVLNLPILKDNSAITRGDILDVNGIYYITISNLNGIINAFRVDERNNVHINQINLKDIKSIRVNNIETFNSIDIKNITDNINTVSKYSSMSSYTDLNKVQNSDLGVGKLNNSEIFFKVIDSETGRIVTNTGEYLSFNNLTDIMFYTKRDISSKTALENIKNNSLVVELKDSSRIESNKFVELKYVVPEKTLLKSLFLLPNNYANIGWFQEASIPLEKGEKDGTKTLINLIKKTGMVGDTIYGIKEDANKSKLKKNINNYRKIERFSDLSSESKEALNILRAGTYFTLYTESSIDPNIYRIIENKGEQITAQYSVINANGDIITRERDFNSKDLLASKQAGDTLYPAGSIANLYLHYKNKNIKSIINSVNNDLNPEQIRTQQAINKLSSKIENTFSNLHIQVIHTADTFEHNQFAKLHSDESGNVSIMLSTQSGRFSDLIHETLHIYLTWLRYTDQNAYGLLMDTLVKEELNIYDKEEEFVKKVVDFSKGNIDFLYKDLKSFITQLVSVVNGMVKTDTGEDLLLDIDNIINNPLEFLNTSLGELYAINPVQNDHPLYNVGLLAAEPMFRNWMKDNNIILKCN